MKPVDKHIRNKIRSDIFGAYFTHMLIHHKITNNIWEPEGMRQRLKMKFCSHPDRTRINITLRNEINNR